MRGKRTRSTSGITLIALVITIILLVILATISINAVFGDNGLITKAQKAGEVYEEKQEWERLELVKGEVAFDSAQNGNTGKYTVEDYVNRIIEKEMVVQRPQEGTGTDPQIVITDKGWIVNISQDGERNVVFTLTKYEGTIVIPMRITGMTLTPSLKNMTIGVSITTSNTEGATYKYSYKKAVEQDGAYKEVYSGGNTSYTITGKEIGATALETDVIYTVKVKAERGSETTELTKNVEIRSIPVATGAIEFSSLNWNNGKAEVRITKKIADSYIIKYKVEDKVGTTVVTEREIASGGKVEQLELGYEVIAWLEDSEGNKGAVASLTIDDIIAPKQAKITLSTGKITIGQSITATIEQEDGESGVEIANCKWVYTTTNTALGTLDTDLNKYESGIINETYGEFSGATINGNKVTKNITLKETTTGTYYVHVLTGDKAGNRIETISGGVTVEEIPSGRIALSFGNVVWNNGKAEVKITKTIADSYIIKYKVEDKVGTTVVTERAITSGDNVTGLELGNVVTAWLEDSEGNKGAVADLTIADGINPERATIGIFHEDGSNTEISEIAEGGIIKVTIELEDKQSGIDINESRWIITTDDKAIGTDAATYQGGAGISGTFVGATETDGETKGEKEIEITMPSGITDDTTYYLHILTVDKAGNKKETISTKTITENVAIRVTSLGLKIIEKDGIAITPEEIIASGSEVEVKKGKTIKLGVDYNPGETEPSDSLKGVTWSITSGVSSYVTLNTTTGLVTGVAEIPSGTTVTVTATSTSNTSVSVSCKINVLIYYSWEELEEIAKAISAASDTDIPINTAGPIVYNNGVASVDTTGTAPGKRVEIGDITYVRFKESRSGVSDMHLVKIVGFKHDLLAEDGYNTGYTPIPFSETGTKKYAGITFEFVNCITESIKMREDVSLYNSWFYSDVRNTTLTSFITNIEDSTYGQKGLNMKKVYKETWTLGKNGEYAENVENELWLFSEREIFGSVTTSCQDTTTGKYEGYHYPYFTNDSSRSKAQNDKTSTKTTWWLRSPNVKSTGGFNEVATDGAKTTKRVSGGANRISPGFAI